MGERGDRPTAKVLPDHVAGRDQLTDDRRQWVRWTRRYADLAGSSGGPASRRTHAPSPGCLSDGGGRVKPRARETDRRVAGVSTQASDDPPGDAAEFEDHLREQMASLADAGTIRRRSISRGRQAHGRCGHSFARVCPRALGPSLEATRSSLRHRGAAGRGPRGRHRRARLAVAAGVAIKLPALFGHSTWTRRAASTPATSASFSFLLIAAISRGSDASTPDAGVAGGGVRRGGHIRERLSFLPWQPTPRP